MAPLANGDSPPIGEPAFKPKGRVPALLVTTALCRNSRQVCSVPGSLVARLQGATLIVPPAWFPLHSLFLSQGGLTESLPLATQANPLSLPWLPLDLGGQRA